MNIFGYPNYISGGSGGGTTYTAGAGLTSTTNPDGTVTLSASGSFLTWYYDPTIPNSRGLVAGNNVTISNAVDGQCTISAQVTGSGATSSGSYLTMVTEASLPQSRVATEGNGITITDAGAGGAGTIGVASTITGANILTWAPGDTILTGRRALILGSGLSSSYGTNTLTLSVTGQNAGTVTSVDLAVPSFLTVSGNPITTAGTITVGLASQSAGTLLIAPSGSTGSPTFRRILGQDLPIFAGSNVTVTTNATGGLVISSTASSGGAGSVTSVGLALPADTFTISNSPVTGTGTLTGTYANQAINTFLAGASSGAPGTPAWRILTRNDLPITPGSNVSFTLNSSGGISINASVSGGGGGTVTSVDSTTPVSLFTVSGNPITLSGTLAYALTPAACSLVWAGPASGPNANPTYRSLVAADIPTLPFTKISGTVPIGQGGTNLTATPTNGQLPIGNGTGYTLAGITPGTGVQVANGAGTITVSATGALGGTVTSVAQTVPSIMSVAGSPITGAGTLAISLVNQSSATAFLGPSSGAAGVPSFRSILTSDLPSTVGTVQSVALSLPSIITVSGSPVTTTGTLTGTLATQASATVFAGPTSGANATPAFRALVAADLPVGTGTVTSVAQSVPASLLSISGSPVTTAGTLALGLTNAASGQFWAGPATGAATTPAYRSILVSDLPSTVGTVQSVGVSVPAALLTVSGSPVTTSGTIAIALANAASATVFAGPSSGAAAAGAYRALLATDLPSTTVNSTGNLSPLFTSSISAQALSFAAVNQTQALAFLSPASSTGAPTFRSIGGSDLAAGIVAGSNITITQLPGTNQMSIASTASGGSGGGFTASTITANATAAVSTVTFVDLASGNVTVALQTAVGQGGKEIKIKIINNIVPPNTLTINCTATNGAGTIDGSASTITSQYVSDAWTFQSANGSAWYIF